MPTKVIKDLNELLPIVKQKVEQLILKCENQGITIQIIETYRSQERQNELYLIGRRGILGEKQVTWTKSSRHTSRRAFDFVPIVNGNADWKDLNKFYKVGQIGKSLGLTYGGDWEMPDNDHLEYNGLDLNIVQEDAKTVEELVDRLFKIKLINTPNEWIYSLKGITNINTVHLQILFNRIASLGDYYDLNTMLDKLFLKGIITNKEYWRMVFVNKTQPNLEWLVILLNKVV